MDFAYLLWLQNLRNSFYDLTAFMKIVGTVSTACVLLIPVFVYWCLNKKNGLFLITSFGIGFLSGRILKITFCIYRPWLQYPEIVPVPSIIEKTTGYSFPSGHTTRAASVFGATALLYRKKSAFIAWLCVFFIILTAFSRNYLCVHTLTDVLCGILVGVFVIYITSEIFKFVSEKPERENLFYLIGLILCGLSLAYVKLKSYPMDYVDGKLIVGPEEVIEEIFCSTGMLAGSIAGRFFEKNFVKFSSVGFSFKSLIFAGVGAVIFCSIYYIPKDLAYGILNGEIIEFMKGFLMFVFALAVWPFILKKFFERKN